LQRVKAYDRFRTPLGEPHRECSGGGVTVDAVPGGFLCGSPSGSHEVTR
jgi:hypothetical protein